MKNRIQSYETRRQKINKIAERTGLCITCPIREQCIKPVSYHGNIYSPIMIVAEAPGYYEDLYGCPLIGKSGQYLDKVLFELGVTRDCVYTTNTVKCRPTNNRTPRHEESIKCGRKWLEREIKIIRPKVILILGSVALKYFFGSNYGIINNRGKVFDYLGIDCVATYHPAALLRAEGEDLEEKRAQFYSDIKLALDLAKFYNPLHTFSSNKIENLFSKYKKRSNDK